MSTIAYAVLAMFLVMVSSAQAAESAAEVRSCDVAVYGGTSSGVIAAVEAARLGRSVTLIEPAGHLGGMTASGLGLTDMGNTPSIGGLAREFYHRIWVHYRDEKNWRYTTRNQYLDWHPLHWGFKGSDVDKLEVLFTFEPHVAEKVFDAMASEAGVVVLKGERLDLKNGAKMAGGRIEEIRLESGLRIAAKVFIDATYEGDLLALAGVRHIIGREPNSLYNETFNGIRPSHIQPVDPFVVPGDPASGVLPRILPKPPGGRGEGDHRIQPYNFRLCLTDVPENRAAFTKPANYDPKQYELLGREMLRHKNARPGRSKKIFPVCLLGDEKEGILNFSWDPLESTCRHASLSIL